MKNLFVKKNLIDCMCAISNDLRQNNHELPLTCIANASSSLLTCPLHLFRKVLVMSVLLLSVCVGNAWGETVSTGTSDTWSGGKSGGGAALYITKSGMTINITSGYQASDEIRWYSGATLTITSTVGKITKVVFNTGGTNVSVPSGGSGTWNSGTNTWSGNNATVTLKSSAQVKWKTVTITYTPSAATHTLSSAVSPTASGTVTLSATSVTEGSTATATATPNTHYVFTNWSISGTGSTLSSTTDNPTTVTMGTANTTVTANFSAAPKASITLSEAGATTTDATTYYVGDTYTLPTSTEATCGTKVLVGWSTVTVTETDTKPTSNFYEKGASVTLEASQTFYAVFATASAGGGPTTRNYTITFNDNGTDSSTDLTTSNFKGQVTGNADSISSVSATTKCYAGNGGLKMASQKQNGSFTLILAHSLPIKKVVLNAKRGAETEGGTNSVTVGSTAFSTTSSYSTSFVDLEFTGTKTTSNSLTITSTSTTNAGTSNANRVSWLKSITIYYEILGGTTYSAYTTSCAACDDDPTVGTAQLKGSFNLSNF